MCCECAPRHLTSAPPPPLRAYSCPKPSRVYLQEVGLRKFSRAESRVLHFDLTYAALKLIEKEAIRLVLKLDAINQLIYDESEPRSIIVSCHDDRRCLIMHLLVYLLLDV